MSDETNHTRKDIITEKVQAQFGANAHNYVTSSVHAKGAELELMIEMAQPTPDDLVLDIATGGGHTALAFAPHVKHVTATDITPAMLEAAQAFITPQADNVDFKLADAEALPFDDAAFDIVTCRVAPHHFPDAFQFVREAARVLKPGGRLVIQDHDAPTSEADAEYMDAFERLRDPSHVKAYSEVEWRGMVLDAGLTVERTAQVAQSDPFIPWAERMSCPPDVIERLTVLMVQAPDGVKAWLGAQAVGTAHATLLHRYVIIAGRKAIG